VDPVDRGLPVLVRREQAERIPAVLGGRREHLPRRGAAHDILPQVVNEPYGAVERAHDVAVLRRARNGACGVAVQAPLGVVLADVAAGVVEPQQRVHAEHRVEEAVVLAARDGVERVLPHVDEGVPVAADEVVVACACGEHVVAPVEVAVLDADADQAFGMRRADRVADGLEVRHVVVGRGASHGLVGMNGDVERVAGREPVVQRRVGEGSGIDEPDVSGGRGPLVDRHVVDPDGARRLRLTGGRGVEAQHEPIVLVRKDGYAFGDREGDALPSRVDVERAVENRLHGPAVVAALRLNAHGGGTGTVGLDVKREGVDAVGVDGDEVVAHGGDDVSVRALGLQDA